MISASAVPNAPAAYAKAQADAATCSKGGPDRGVDIAYRSADTGVIPPRRRCDTYPRNNGSMTTNSRASGTAGAAATVPAISDDGTRAAQLRAARAGDRDVWHALYGEFTPMMRAIARRCRLNEADCDDVVQSAWERAFKHLASVRDPERIAGWLATTTLRESLRATSIRDVPSETWQLDGPELSATPEEAAIEADQILRVREAFARLSERDRRLLGLLMHDEPTGYATISARLHMPVGSIGPTRRRALGRLRPLLAELGFPEALAEPAPQAVPMTPAA